MKFDRTTMIEALRRLVKWMHYPLEVMLVCVRWYAAYQLSFRNIEEMMVERGVAVDHSTLHRWSMKMLPVLAAAFRRRKRPVGLSWRMDETYVKVAGQWKYLYRSVDRAGNTVDFLLRAKRDHAAARAFFERAIDLHGVPETITIDKSGANAAAIMSMQADSGLPIAMRQSTYLNNIIEQDHRTSKRIPRPMLGFKSFRGARILIAGVEVMHIIRKGQLCAIKDRAWSTANLFYSMAFWSASTSRPGLASARYRDRTHFQLVRSLVSDDMAHRRLEQPAIARPALAERVAQRLSRRSRTCRGRAAPAGVQGHDRSAQNRWRRHLGLRSPGHGHAAPAWLEARLHGGAPPRGPARTDG